MIATTNTAGARQNGYRKSPYHPLERDEGVLRVTTLIDEPILDRTSTSCQIEKNGWRTSS